MEFHRLVAKELMYLKMFNLSVAEPETGIQTPRPGGCVSDRRRTTCLVVRFPTSCSLQRSWPEYLFLLPMNSTLVFFLELRVSDLTLLQEKLTGSAIFSEGEVTECGPCCLAQFPAHSRGSGSGLSTMVCGSATASYGPHCPSQWDPRRGLPHHPDFLFGAATGSARRRQEEEGSLVGVLHSFSKGHSS